MEQTGFTIQNGRELQRLFKKLEMSDRNVASEVRKVMKAPFNEIKKKAKSNLKAQGSIVKGNLYRGLAVGSSFKKSRGYFSVAFGGRKRGAKMNHFHFVNSGTKSRVTKSGANRGAVGKARTAYRGRNSSFRLAFADKAIRGTITTIPSRLTDGIRDIVYSQIRKTPT